MEILKRAKISVEIAYTLAEMKKYQKMGFAPEKAGLTVRPL